MRMHNAETGRFLVVRLVFSFFLLISIVIHTKAAEVSLQQTEQHGEFIRNLWPKERPINEAVLAENGVRRLDGKHIVFLTDLASSPSVDELPIVFDLAFESFCDFFGLIPEKYDAWKAEAFLIGDEKKFHGTGVLDQVAKLRNGYALRNRIWLREQPSEYYRRHLLIHEGVHAFMGFVFGNWGPPWYREGTAELLGTHRWENGKLTLGIVPEKADETPNWRRIQIVRDDFAKKQGKPIDAVFQLAAEDYNENEAYAWSWAFAAFCENNPLYRDPFRQTARFLSSGEKELGRKFEELLDDTAKKRIDDDWEDFVANIDFGYDFERTRIADVSKGKNFTGDAEVAVLADRGWQNSGLYFEKGKTYEISASGRFQLGDSPKIWWSEPNGITIRYHRGAPMGILLATLIPDADVAKTSAIGVGFASPRIIGNGGSWTVEQSGTLFFRLNDFPSELSDNQGTATVRIR